MRAFRLCISGLLAALLALTGCGASSYTKKGQEKKSDTVTINNCVADPDTVIVPKGNTLTWKGDPQESPPHTYTIKFGSKKPIANPTVPTGQGQTVTGDLSCTLFGWISSKNCLFPYQLIQDDTKTTCKDPGVHVGGG